MREDDVYLLECIEDIYHVLNKGLKRVDKVRSVHVQMMQALADELRSERRIFEEISFPARLIVEHLLETQFKGGQVALEAEQLRQAFSTVKKTRVDEFGIIRVMIGDLEIAWRDGSYSYYFYPDKVELRASDEKSAVKLFFSLAFGQQSVERFPEIVQSPNVAYIHPQIEKWLRKG